MDDKNYFNQDIVELARENAAFRQVLFTAEYTQVTLRSLPEKESTGEVAMEVDSTFLCVAGEAKITVDAKEDTIVAGRLLFIPAGIPFAIESTATEELKLIEVLSPPEFEPGTIQETKADDAARLTTIAEDISPTPSPLPQTDDSR
jgi:mannose-6-phosphate isomerase-like protein (cupin superfamily)